MRPYTCAGCGVTGHKRPACPNPTTPPKPKRVRERFVPPPTVFTTPADRPYHLAESTRSHAPDEPAHTRVWRHVTTGEEIHSTWPPFDWERCMEGAVVLRHLRDAEQLRAMEPEATVTVRPSASTS